MLQPTRRQLLQFALGQSALAGVTLAAPALIRRARAADAEALVLYNGQHRTTTEALVAAFTKATGIPVTLRNGESPELASQLTEEGARSPADLFYSEQSPPIASLGDKGMLAPIDAATLKEVPTLYQAKDGLWVGGSVRCRVIVFNKAMTSAAALPTSILDFAKPEMKDRFGYAPNDGFQEQIMAIEILNGRPAALAWLKGLKANGKAFRNNRSGVKAVDDGEVGAMMTNNYYWYSLAKEAGGADRLKTALHYMKQGDPGAVVNISAAGILKTSKRMPQAQRFLAFMVSAAGQQAVVDSVAEYPVRSAIVSPYPLYPLDKYGASTVTAGDIGAATDAYALEREAGIL